MVLAVWDDGTWQPFAAVAVIILVAYLLIMWIAAIIWTLRDVQSRTRDVYSQIISVMLVVVFNFPGLLLYLILRPKESLAEAYDRQLEAQAILHEMREQPTCPTCRRRVNEEFVACPFCRAALRVPCETCNRPLASGWVLCPFCGEDRMPAIKAAPTVQALPPSSEAAGAQADEARAPASPEEQAAAARAMLRRSRSTPAPAAPVAAPPPSTQASTDGLDAT